MAFTTYENRNNPHVAIHRDDCRHLRKHGGVPGAYTKQKYIDHPTYAKARQYAIGTGLPLLVCSTCDPH